MNRRSDGVGERDREVIDPLRAESHPTTVLGFIELDEAQVYRPTERPQYPAATTGLSAS